MYLQILKNTSTINGKLRQYLKEFNQGNASTNDVHRHFAMAFNS